MTNEQTSRFDLDSRAIFSVPVRNIQIVGLLRDAVMRLLVLCAWALGVGIILLAGFLVTAQELFSESIFGVPHEPGVETEPGYMDEERSTSSSSTPIG